MSSLMIALASLAGVVLAGVVIHGAWQAPNGGAETGRYATHCA